MGLMVINDCVSHSFLGIVRALLIYEDNDICGTLNQITLMVRLVKEKTCLAQGPTIKDTCTCTVNSHSYH